MTAFGRVGDEKQIPCGDDRKKGKSKGKCKRRFPSGMTSER
jgi:hypothetical protein